MKRTILLLSLISFTFLPAIGQDLVYSDTLIEKEGPLDGQSKGYYNNIYNVSGSSKQLSWARTINDMPGNWSSVLCIGELCYDTSTSAGVFLNLMKVGDSSLLSIYIQNDGVTAGTGTVEITVWDQNDSANSVVSSLYKYTNWPLGISDPKSGDELVAFPNPTSGQLSLAIGDHANVHAIEIYDISGRKVSTYPKPLGRISELDVSHLSRGQYIVRLLDKAAWTINSRMVVIQ